MADALSRIYGEGSESDESLDNNVANNINGNCVEKKDLQEMVDSFSDLPPNRQDRQTVVQNNSGKTYFWNLINELPLAFTDFKQHQMIDFECNQIISSIKYKTHNAFFCG